MVWNNWMGKKKRKRTPSSLPPHSKRPSRPTAYAVRTGLLKLMEDRKRGELSHERIKTNTGWHSQLDGRGVLTNKGQPTTAYDFKRCGRIADRNSQIVPGIQRLLHPGQEYCVNRHWKRHTFDAKSKVQCAFKDSMIHWILQFALRIAFRCVLHRCENRDIHC